MSLPKDSSRLASPDTVPVANAALRPRRFGARRLLVATIGAATVNYVTGCQTSPLFTSVANLMAPPFMPNAGHDALNDPSVPVSNPLPGVVGGTGGAAAVGDGDAGAADQDAGSSK